MNERKRRKGNRAEKGERKEKVTIVLQFRPRVSRKVDRQRLHRNGEKMAGHLHPRALCVCGRIVHRSKKNPSGRECRENKTKTRQGLISGQRNQNEQLWVDHRSSIARQSLVVKQGRKKALCEA